MRFGIYVPNFGAFGDVETLTDLARRADRSGWDGFFLWDHLIAPQPVVDPWIALTAVAAATERIALGPLIVPLPRRRPWRVALEAATLQKVTRGRLILGVGLGTARDFTRFGEAAGSRERAERLTEGVELVSRLLAGDEVTTAGRHYSLDRVRLTPASVPIWAGGMWPRRGPIHGARFAQGFYPVMRSPAPPRAAGDPRKRDRDAELGVARPSLEDMCAFLARAIADGGPASADLVLWTPDGPDGVNLDMYRDAGVTWWLQGEEAVRPDELRRRIEAGPPAPPDG